MKYNNYLDLYDNSFPLKFNFDFILNGYINGSSKKSRDRQNVINEFFLIITSLTVFYFWKRTVYLVFVVKMSVNKNNNPHEDNIKFTGAKCEEEMERLITEKNEMMKDFNTRMKIHLDEIRLLKEVNDKLQTDLNELRDLCCYLDDDRQKCRRLAKEWQNFGRHINSTLDSKITSQQEEVNSLHSQQETIIAENLNLKSLCQDLERKLGEKEYMCIQCSQRLEPRQQAVFTKYPITSSPTHINHTETKTYYSPLTEKYSDQDSPIFFSDESDHSKDSSERNVKAHARKKKVSFVEPDEVSESDDERPKHVPFPTKSNDLQEHLCHGILRNGIKNSQSKSLDSDTSMESESSLTNINKAMQVLEIHTKLQEETQDMQKVALKDREVAVLKEMCNVVWQKLSSDPSSNRTADTLTNGCTDDVIYEDLL